jgi:outer membrane protein assembly factor BamB
VIAAAAVSVQRVAPPQPQPQPHPRVIWSAPIAWATLRPSFDSAYVYFGDEQHRVFQLARKDGRRVWQAQATPSRGPNFQLATGSVVAGPVVAVPDAQLFGLDRTDGTVRWRSSIICFSHAPATDGENVYAGCGDGRTFSFEAPTGALKWTARVADDTGGVIFNPVVHSDTVYVGYMRRTNPATGGVGAIEARTGRRVWYREFERSRGATSSHGDAKIVNDLVIAASDNGEIYALERSTGNVRWKAPRIPVPGDARNDTRPLAVVGQHVIAGSSGGEVQALDAATGSMRWKKELRGSIVVPFASDSARVFIVNPGGRILALDASTGAIAWTFGSSSEENVMILGKPALRGDTVFVGGAKAVFALRAYD